MVNIVKGFESTPNNSNLKIEFAQTNHKNPLNKVEHLNKEVSKIGTDIWGMDVVKNGIIRYQDLKKAKDLMQNYAVTSVGLLESAYSNIKIIPQFFKSIGVDSKVIPEIFSGFNQASSLISYGTNVLTTIFIKVSLVFAQQRFDTFNKYDLLKEIKNKKSQLKQLEKSKKSFDLSDTLKNKIESVKSELIELESMKLDHKKFWIIHKTDLTMTSDNYSEARTSLLLKTVTTVGSVVKYVFKFIGALPLGGVIAFQSLIVLPILVVKMILDIRNLKTNYDTLKLHNKIMEISKVELESVSNIDEIKSYSEDNKSVITTASDVRKTFLIIMNAKHRIERKFVILNLVQAHFTLGLTVLATFIGVAGAVTAVLTATGVVAFPPLAVILGVVGIVVTVGGLAVSLGFFATKYGMLKYYKPHEFDLILEASDTKQIWVKALGHFVSASKKEELLDIYKSEEEYVNKAGIEDVYYNLTEEERQLISPNQIEARKLMNRDLLGELETEDDRGITYLYKLVIKEKGGSTVGVKKASIFGNSSSYLKLIEYIVRAHESREEYHKKEEKLNKSEKEVA
jgi:hypothetical protein